MLTRMAKGEGWLGKCRQWLTKGGGGVREMLTMADKGGRGVWTPHFWLTSFINSPL